MLKRYQSKVGVLFRVIDSLIVAAVWLFSYWLRFHVPIIEVTKGFPDFETYVALLPVVMFLWIAVFSSQNLYQHRAMIRRTHESFLVLKAHAMAMLMFLALTYLFSEYRYSRVVMVYFGLVSGVLLVYSRVGLRNFVRGLSKKGIAVQRTLVVGEQPAAERLISSLNRFPELGYQVIRQLPASEIPNIQDWISKERIQHVVIALRRYEIQELDQLLSSLKNLMLEIQLLPDLNEFMVLGCRVEDFDGIPVVNLNDSPLHGWAVAGKRLVDLIFSGLGLILLGPFLVLLGILVKLTSKGPILYRQERMGLDGKTFQMLKFRSMRVDAETQSGAVWAKENDPRRTRFGSFIRATSLDELPQFWNVFKGDMSLVGPRPERPVFVSKFKQEIPDYMLRHKVKAGLTGWAQVNGWRGNTSLEKRIEFDLYYIRNWSFVLDFKILIMTFWRGFLNKNAY